MFESRDSFLYGYAVLNEKFVFSEADDKLCNMMNYSSGEISNKDFEFIFPRNSDNFFITEFKSSIFQNGHAVLEHDVQKKDGTTFNAIIMAQRIDERRTGLTILNRSNVSAVQGEQSIPFRYDYADDTLIFPKSYDNMFGGKHTIANFTSVVMKEGYVSERSVCNITDFLKLTNNDVERGSFNIELKDTSGSYSWYLVTATNMFNAEGIPVKATGFLSKADRKESSGQNRIEKDASTGLYSKATTEMLIRRKLKTSGGNGFYILMKLDDIVNINAKLGHLAVDAIINSFSLGLLSAFPNDTLGKIGGIDFALFLDKASKKDALTAVAKIPLILNDIVTDASVGFPITLSIGIADAKSITSYTKLHEYADAAMCRAKNNGGNQYVIYSEELEGEALLSTGKNKSDEVISESATGKMWAKLIEKLYSSSDIQEGIKSAIAFLGNTFKVDRITVFELPSAQNKEASVIQWCADNIPHTETNIRDKNSNLFFNEYVNGTHEMPEEIIYSIDTSQEKNRFDKIFSRIGIKSHIHCILKNDDMIIGNMGFEMCSETRVWFQQEIDLLTLMSKLIAESIKERRSVDFIKALHQRTKNIIDSVTSGIYVIDEINYKIMYFNEAMKQINVGIELGDTCYRSFFGLNAPCENCKVKMLNDDTRSINSIVKYGNKGMSYDVVTSEMLWENDQSAFIINVNEHIETTEESEYRRMQERLEKKYAFIYRHSCDYIIDIDINTGKYVMTLVNNNSVCIPARQRGDYNKEFYTILEKFAHPDDFKIIVNANSLIALMKQIKSGKKDTRAEYRLIRDGNTYWEESHAFFIDDDESPSIVIAYRDISEEKRLAEFVALEKQRLYVAVSSIYPLVLSVNLTQNQYSILRFTDIYSNAIKKADGSYTDYISSVVEQYHPDFRNVIYDSYKCENMVEYFQKSGSQIYRELKKTGIDGKYHWVSVLAIRIDNSFDSDNLAMILIRNIDAQKETENNLRVALSTAENANTAKSDFLSRMSHEIRTPMNAIIGMTELARNSTDKPDYIQQCLSKIDLSSHYLLSIINDILDMSRIENNKIIISNEDFNYREFVDGIDTLIAPQAKDKEINFSIVEKNISSDCYVGDQIRIKQVLVNLLSNSLKFTQADGNITLEIEEKQRKGKDVFMHFSVSDTGCGMSPEFLKKIYKPFEQEFASNVGKGHGTGLGLSISKNLITIMGGHIQVHSEVGKGTRFDVELKLGISEKHLQTRAAKTAEEREKYDFKGKRVLLAEDNEINLEIATALLEDKNFEVDCAENGQQAVDKFMASSVGYYDAILMDIMMPIKNGLDASKEIRELEREDASTVPIIAMTANAFSEDITKSFAHGMNDHLAKPIEPDKLYDALEMYISK